jgi:lipopolysaccharide transport system permease protein
VSIVPESLRPLFDLNPITVVIQGFRWALLNVGVAPGSNLLTASVVVVVGIVSGAYVFRRTERTVVDIL